MLVVISSNVQSCKSVYAVNFSICAIKPNSVYNPPSPPTSPHSLRTLAGRLSCGVFKMVGDGIQAVEVPISGQSV